MAKLAKHPRQVAPNILRQVLTACRVQGKNLLEAIEGFLGIQINYP